MRHAFAFVLAALMVLLASPARADTPHLRPKPPSLTGDAGPVWSHEVNGAFLFVPHGQSIGAPTTTLKAAFPMRDGKDAVTFGLDLGAGWSQLGKTYLVTNYDMGYVFPIFGGDLGVEVGGRLTGLFPLDDRRGYGTGYGLGPYGHFLIPATLMFKDGPSWLYSRLGGGLLLGHLEATDRYPDSVTTALPYVTLGFGIDFR